MSLQLKRATRKQVKLKVGIQGPSGSGKTFSALLLAYGICQDWSKIAVIDTENKSASLYSHLGEFGTIDLEPPFSPQRYIEALKICAEAGIEVIIIDSATHEWDGQGGCLEMVENLKNASRSKNAFTEGWSKVTPQHKKFIDAILQVNAHVITCTRTKVEYVIQQDERGKNEIKKVGLKAITREGFEYELTVNWEIVNQEHYVSCSKDRTGLFESADPFIITKETGVMLRDWCNQGVDEVQDFLSRLAGVKNRAEFETIQKNNGHLFTVPEVDKKMREVAKKFPKPKTKKKDAGNETITKS